MSELSERLRELRGSQSQREMADAIGIKWNAWARYERGEVSPGAEILRQICIAHACSADWLLGLPQRGSTSTAIANGGVAITGSGNKIRGTIVAGGDAGHAPACAKCPYKKWGEKLRKQGLVIPGVK